jgi:hypothetical protein
VYWVRLVVLRRLRKIESVKERGEGKEQIEVVDVGKAEARKRRQKALSMRFYHLLDELSS